MPASPIRRFSPAPFTQVAVEDGFWAPRIRTNRERTIPHAYRQLEETGRIGAFRLDWKPGREPVPHIFWDSDVAKWLEGASCDLALHPDPERERLVSEVASLIASAQQPDGYLNVHFTVVEPDRRWTNLRDCHELYCAGHLVEAAVAHHRATGSRVLLDALIRYVDYIASVFGREPGKKRGYPGHEEIELALVKLYRLTGEERFLRLSQYFVDERGQEPSYFAAEAAARGEPPSRHFSPSYYQAHRPVREQAEAVGHSVRAMYLYSAMADLAAELGDQGLREVCERLWESATQRRMYITGGVGSTSEGERFTDDYDLPNETAYAETCAAIGLIFFAQRMLQFDCDGRYADAMERALYNGAISGVSLDGERFFYVNPLASRGAHHREDWFGCACCPPNVIRLVPTIGACAYSTAADEVAVHLYLQGRARLVLDNGAEVRVRQKTEYPWQGKVRLTVEVERPAEFTLRLRLPGWCRQYELAVDGAAAAPLVERGYACLRRTWHGGEVVELDLAMPVEKMEAHPQVVSDFGRVALQRGPIVYCLEGVDHAESVRTIVLPKDGELTPRFEPGLLGGVAVLEGEAAIRDISQWEGPLYQPAAPARLRPTRLRAIPYCVWDNRAPGEMTVWIPKA